MHPPVAINAGGTPRRAARAPGELVGVYGYAAVLVVPVSSFIEGGYDLSRGLVAARRVVNFLALEPDSGDADTVVDAPGGPAPLHDPASGVEVAPGKLTALVSEPEPLANCT